MSGTTHETAQRAQTTVEVRCTGHVRDAVGEPHMRFTFEGTTLRAFLEAFCDRYDVADLLIAETESDAATEGWAPELESLPGTWKKNPEGDQTRCYARVTVDGQFNEHLDGLDTELDGEDRIGLLYPFIFCC
ncbi:pterin cluster protein [Halomicroarcula sp. F13]|uniref:Pterin cluster protein n=1 Tax=Haloarcula rubra TaxID=2487747 RepID=A0AAW4PM45_9EURY|nr:pterin cluster protein [Halomicroarcula rubra]MBX0322191.1 pterin cluster protein [Halomicroarcula rubra]